MENQNLLVYHFSRRFSTKLKANLNGEYNLLLARTMEDAASQMCARRVVCVITGLSSEGAPGLEEVLQLKSRFQTIPMIVCSKQSDPEIIDKCGRLGIQRFVRCGSLDQLEHALPEVIACASFSPDFRIFRIDPHNLPARIQNALDLIANGFLEDMTIGEIASHLDVHRCHLHREFREHCHVTPKQLMIGLRLHYATYLMDNRGMKIKHVAELANFTDCCELSRVFRRHLGMTPGEFRRRYSFGDFPRLYR